MSVPPARDVALPREETVTSIRDPSEANAGNSDVTITAAVFFVWT